MFLKRFDIKSVKVELLTDEDLDEAADYVISCVRLEAKKKATYNPEQSKNARKSAVIWKMRHGGGQDRREDAGKSAEILGNAGEDPDR